MTFQLNSRTSEIETCMGDFREFAGIYLDEWEWKKNEIKRRGILGG